MLPLMKFTLKSLVISCLLLTSSNFVAWSAEPKHNFDVWEKEISAYERMDATNPPPKDGIEFLGSSVIARWKTLKRDFPGQPVFDRGFGGSWVMDSTHFADRIVIPYTPKKIFFRAGGNDLAAGKTAEEVFSDFKDFATLIHSNLPQTVIYFISWNPTPSRWKQHETEKAWNTMVAGFIEGKPYLRYIEMYDLPLGADGKPRPELFVADRLHYNAEGYKLMADRIRPYVEEPIGDSTK